jgi:hypothetical protein
MRFTDDNLKRLKKRADANDPTEDWLRALIARLEAAECILENGIALTHTEDCDKVEHHDLVCTCGSQEKWEAWRKAAGK